MRNPAILAISAVAATVIVLAPAGTCGNSRPAGSAGPAASPETKAVAGLRDLARAGSVLLDGDECMEIVTDRAAELMFKEDPADRWAGSDNYDVDLEKFTRTKKLLIRISKLGEFPADCNLWMRTKKRPEKIHMVIRQVHVSSSFYEFGQMVIDPPEELKKALTAGEPVVVAGKKRGLVSVFAPVRNSLGDVVGLVEASTRLSLLEPSR